MLREARLKPESAEYYPTLSPDRWYTAAAVAGLATGARIIRDGPSTTVVERILQSDQFEFRGGSPRSGSWAGMRTRHQDRRARPGSRHRELRLRLSTV